MMNTNYESVIQYRRSLRSIRKWHLFFCLLGFVISCYAVYVELKLEGDPGYTALCDISPDMSCTRVFGSEWGKGFGFVGKVLGENSTFNQPNGLYGLISYPIFTFTSRFECLFLARTNLAIGIAGIALSGYLGYILIYILNDICVVCFTIYGVNFFLMITSFLYYRNMKGLKEVLQPSPTPQKMEVKKQV